MFVITSFAERSTHRVSRKCFHPVPDVDSTLLALERRETPVQFSAAGRGLIRVLFQQRRKQVAPLIKRQAPSFAITWLEFLERVGIRADARAESVPVSAWIELDRLVRATGELPKGFA